MLITGTVQMLHKKHLAQICLPLMVASNPAYAYEPFSNYDPAQSPMPCTSQYSPPATMIGIVKQFALIVPPDSPLASVFSIPVTSSQYVNGIQLLSTTTPPFFQLVTPDQFPNLGAVEIQIDPQCSSGADLVGRSSSTDVWTVVQHFCLVPSTTQSQFTSSFNQAPPVPVTEFTGFDDSMPAPISTKPQTGADEAVMESIPESNTKKELEALGTKYTELPADISKTREDLHNPKFYLLRYKGVNGVSNAAFATGIQKGLTKEETLQTLSEIYQGGQLAAEVKKTVPGVEVKRITMYPNGEVECSSFSSTAFCNPVLERLKKCGNCSGAIIALGSLLADKDPSGFFELLVKAHEGWEIGGCAACIWDAITHP
jgi:hypothetical protein